ncbi:MAG: hypothetical protein JKY42_05135 [Flavobacteriales bacterium]|nr:hypothetical protein [Flavobacteriales bacterium]
MKTRKILVAVLALAFIAPAFQSCKPSSKGKIDGEWTVNLLDYSGTSSGTSTVSGVTGSVKNDGTFTYDFDGSAISWNTSDTDTDNDNNITIDEQDMDAGVGSWTNTDTYNGVATSETGSYSSDATMTYSFVKDGTYSSTETNTTEVVETETDPWGTDDFFGVVTTVVTTTDEVSKTDKSGEWSFLGKNKSAELKANERIALTYLSAKESITTTVTEVTTVVDNTSGASTVETEKDVDSEDVDYTYTSTGSDEVWRLTESKKKSLKAEITIDSTSSSTSSNANTPDGSSTTTTTYTYDGSESATGTIEMTQD